MEGKKSNTKKHDLLFTHTPRTELKNNTVHVTVKTPDGGLRPDPCLTCTQMNVYM